MTLDPGGEPVTTTPALAREARGDRGLGPVVRDHPNLVLEIDVDGSNPDVDTPADLAALETAPDPTSR